jgi:S-adenosylmethionine hydrolase
MVPLPRGELDGIHAEVLWVDRFGNCQLNIGPDDLDPDADVWSVVIDDERRVAHVATTFGVLGPGSVGLVLDSQGMYALALDQRSAAAELHLAAGDAVVVAPIDEATPTAPATPVELRPPR